MDYRIGSIKSFISDSFIVKENRYQINPKSISFPKVIFVKVYYFIKRLPKYLLVNA